LSAQVKAIIGHDFKDGFPDFETISAALNMSAPTLRRRLKREGTTFQQLKDSSRCSAAKLHLNRPELSINEVAVQLGFTDPSAFHRSFKKWTGQTPGQFRTRAADQRSRL
jgi:AraC-like DNA-binding protein